jgi:hypothetical protein
MCASVCIRKSPLTPKDKNIVDHNGNEQCCRGLIDVPDVTLSVCICETEERVTGEEDRSMRVLEC